MDKKKFDLNRKEDLARFIRSYGARATGTGKDKFDREIMTSINFIRQNRIERELEAGEFYLMLIKELTRKTLILILYQQV